MFIQSYSYIVSVSHLASIPLHNNFITHFLFADCEPAQQRHPRHSWISTTCSITKIAFISLTEASHNQYDAALLSNSFPGFLILVSYLRERVLMLMTFDCIEVFGAGVLRQVNIQTG